MAKPFEKAVTGFNHNIKHKGQHYHVQTEDSGISNPHLITHLFVGGNILATKKTSYKDILSTPNLSELVRELMEEQHKEMLRNLVNGVYDDIDAANKERAMSYQPGVLDTSGPAKSLNTASAQPASAQPASARPVSAQPATAAPTAPVAQPRPPVAPPKPVPAAPVSPLLAPITSPPRPPIQVPPAVVRPVAVPTAVVPPMPLRPKSGPIPLTALAEPSPFEPKPLPPEVLAARELSEAPKLIEEGAETLFGEDLISEKSLDEVILQYLAGDQK
jgi:hypothetical protein